MNYELAMRNERMVEELRKFKQLNPPDRLELHLHIYLMALLGHQGPPWFFLAQAAPALNAEQMAHPEFNEAVGRIVLLAQELKFGRRNASE